MATQSPAANATLVQATKQLVAKKNVKIADVVRSVSDVLAGARRAAAEKIAPVDRLPTPEANLELSPEDAKALQRFVEKVAALGEQPTTVREFNEAEKDRAVAAVNATKDVAAILKRFEAGFGVLFKNHNTLSGERTGEITDDTPRDAKGWALRSAKYSAPGETSTVSLEVRSGAVTLDAEALQAISQRDHESRGDGLEFTHADYLACTTQVRVLDEGKVLTLLKGHPEKAVFLGEAATVANPTISLNKR